MSQGEWSAGAAVPPTSGGISSDRTCELLRQTKPWVRFFSILGFISVGLMVVLGMIAGVAGLAAGQPGMLLLLVVYPAIGLLYIPPSLYLYRYADRIAAFLRVRTGEELDRALEAQKSFWKYVGIFTIVMLCLYAVVLLIAVAAAIAGVA